MKIAIIAGHFMPEIGYQETYLARALSNLKHEVCVFTSDKISPSKKKVVDLNNYKVGISKEKKYKYTIHRLKTSFSFGSWILGQDIKFHVTKYEPDLIIVIGVGKIFPFFVFKIETKIVTLMGNNKDFYSWNSLSAKLNSIKNLLTLKLIKKWIYRRAVKYSDKIFVYTNDTEEIVNSLLSKKLKIVFNNKIVKTTLGFDTDEFYFNEEDYFKIRAQYRIPNESVVVVTSTRVNRDKNIELIIDSISKLQDKGIDIYYFIIGFMADEYEHELKEYIKSKKQYKKFICLPFLNHEKIRQIYCTADIGIWMQAAISIQESMGVGLKVVLEEKGSVNHLIDNEKNGWYFKHGDLNLVLKKASLLALNTIPNHKIIEKRKTEIYNQQRFSYNEISKELLHITFNI